MDQSYAKLLNIAAEIAEWDANEFKEELRAQGIANPDDYDEKDAM